MNVSYQEIERPKIRVKRIEENGVIRYEVPTAGGRIVVNQQEFERRFARFLVS